MNESIRTNIAELVEYFESVKAREVDKLDDNNLYCTAKRNIKSFDEMLNALEDMDLMVACADDFSA